DKLKVALKYDADSVNANHYLGELYRRIDRPEEADRYYRRALDNMVESDSLLHNNYGVFLCSQGKTDAAVTQFMAVLDNPVYPQRAEIYDNIGACYQRASRLAEAEESYRQALKINPRLDKSLLAMAQLTFDDGRYLLTRAYFSRYIEIGVQSAATLWLAINTEHLLQDIEREQILGQELIKLFPTSPEAARYLKREFMHDK
ncbi:MAG: type IV pilus biogenesis/stability protein PilW, partial [Gammaproteobacteria bacterium]|nr:type IV pilus biogenesis/stability protein PilW [Gammaproteobacteria bacterium]